MTSWDDLRVSAEAMHLSLVKQIQAQYPGLWSHSESRTNDIFPLSSVLTLNLSGGNREEDVVLSARFLNIPGAIDFDSDISREDGQILAQGPPGEVGADASLDEQINWAESVLESYGGFVNMQLDLIGRELEKLNLNPREDSRP
jgi:hypothetical protein